MADSNIRFKISQQGSEKVASSFKKIGGVIAGLVAGGVLLRFGKEAVMLAAKMEGVENAFERLNRPGLLDNLRKATRGTVDNLQLMMTTMRASNFKIPLDKLAVLLEFATKRASQTGESVDYLVNSIVDGIGRKSTLVLDNLGISATELQKEMKKVGDFGLATGNIVSRELEKMGDVALTTADKISQISANLENIKIVAGQTIIPVLAVMSQMIVNFFDDVNRTIGSVKELLGIFDDVPQGKGELLSMWVPPPEAIEELKKVKGELKEIEFIYHQFQTGEGMMGFLQSQRGGTKRGGSYWESTFGGDKSKTAFASPKLLKDANKTGQTIFDGWANILTSNMNTAWAEIFGEANSLFEQLINSMVDLLIKDIFSTLLNFIPGGGILGGIVDIFSASPSGGGGTQNITIEMGGMPLGQLVLEGNKQITQRRLV